MGKASVYLPGLNGIRSIAAGAVLLTHVMMAAPKFGLPTLPKSPLADYGVTMFFALSGFLITFLLLLEKEKTGIVHLKKFYFRRILRIWPLYFFYIGLAVLALVIAGMAIPQDQLWYLLTFTPNIPAVNLEGFPNAEHYWSLGVEEQFYLFWPFLIMFTRKPIRFLIGFLVLFLMAKAAFRVIDFSGFAYMFLYRVRFDCMAVGGIGAWIYLYAYKPWLKKLVCSVPAQIVIYIVLTITAIGKFNVFPIISHEIFSVLTVAFILVSISHAKPLLQLENRTMDFLGRISYGLYVYHPLVIFGMIYLLEPLDIGTVPKTILVFASVIGITILVSHFSFRYLEKPFLRLKHKFSVVPSRAFMEKED